MSDELEVEGVVRREGAVELVAEGGLDVGDGLEVGGVGWFCGWGL